MSVSVPVPAPVPACTCFCACLWAYPHCPTTHLPCGRGRSCCPHASDKKTADNTQHTTHLGDMGNRRQTGKDTQDIIIIHHHHSTATPKCHFAASSLALPILRAPLVADAPHVYFQYLARVHRYNTKVLVSLGSHPSPLPRFFSLCTSDLDSQSGPPCPSSSPLCGHCPRGTTVPR